MTKRLTSFLVLATALLFTIPAQAQTFAKKKAASDATQYEAQKKLTTEQLRKVMADHEKAASAVKGTPLRDRTASWTDAVSPSTKTVNKDVVSNGQQTAKAPAMPYAMSRTTFRANRVLSATTMTPQSSHRATSVDEYGIIREPEEGEHKTYKRVGFCYYSYQGDVYYAAQSGTVETVETEDGTIYVKDIISSFIPGTWVKGSKVGNTITIPVGQTVEYYEEYNTSVSLYWGNLDMSTSTYWNKVNKDEITFQIDESGTIRLVGSNENLYIGLFWDDDSSFSGSGDYQSVWTDPLRAITADNIEFLPYTNPLNTLDTFNEFGVIDANQDGKTWYLSNSDIATYSYSSSEYGDDWLVSPAIKLEKDRVYHFAVEASCQSAAYPELFEVRASTDAVADALAAGIQVLPTTEVSNTDFEPYENGTFMVDETGYYHIGIHCTSAPDQFMLKLQNFTVESLTAPEAVSNFTVEQTPNKLEAVIHFTAPTKMCSGDEIVGNISKIEVLRNGVVAATLTEVEPGSEQTVVDVQPNVGWFSYTVLPYDVNGNDKGVESEAIDVLAKATVEIPFTADFSNGKTFDLFSVIDNNEDGSTWGYDADFQAMLYHYDGNNSGDDYLVTLPVHLVENKCYTVKVNANARSVDFPERFEVVMGKEMTPESMTKVLIPATVLPYTAAEDYEANFTVEEEGEYYIAIHAISDPNMYYIILHSMSVTNGPEWTAPAAPEIEVAVAPEGALSAAIRVTAPTKNILGDELTGNLTVSVYRDGAVIERISDVAPGAQVSVDDVLPVPALRYYEAVVANESGDGQKTDKVRTYVGLDVPAEVSGIPTVAETDNGLKFTWQPVGFVGHNGGYVNPAEVTYKLWSNFWRPTILGTLVLNHENELTTVTGENTAEVEFDYNSGDQELKYFSVVPSNTTGTAKDTYTSWIIGQSYEIPIRESFTDRRTQYYWLTNGGLMVSDDSSDGDNFSLRLVATDLPENGGIIYLESGKLNIKDVTNPTLTFNVKSDNIGTIYIYGSTGGGELSLLTPVQITNEYQTVKVPLNAIKDGKYAQFAFVAQYTSHATFDEEGYLIDLGSNYLLDDIRVVDLYDYNLALEMENASKVMAGKHTLITTTIENKGEYDVANYTLTVKAGDEVLKSETFEEPLPMFALHTVETEFATSVFDQLGEVNITAEVTFDGEMMPEDNLAESVINIVAPSVGAPLNLTALEVTDGVELNWTLPSGSGSDIVESFEDTDVFPEFSAGGVTADEPFGHFGDWTVYDGNSKKTYPFPGNTTVPNFGNPMAWFVMNPSSPTLSQDLSEYYGAYSGTQYLISGCPSEPKGNLPDTDHWLISPRLSGMAQTISFYVREFITAYGPETFEVLASTTDNQIESFELVSALSCSSDVWTEVTVDLPEGAKFFAIRHTSNDIWGMMLDEINYQGEGASLASFNIYFQGELIANVEGEVTTYFVPADQLTDGDNMEFDVTAVYTDGTESLPATAIITITTEISEIAADGQPVDIYTLDGRLVRSQTKNLNGLRGLYIVNGQKVMVK